jgi:hypothetical protein
MLLQAFPTDTLLWFGRGGCVAGHVPQRLRSDARAARDRAEARSGTMLPGTERSGSRLQLARVCPTKLAWPRRVPRQLEAQPPYAAAGVPNGLSATRRRRPALLP